MVDFGLISLFVLQVALVALTYHFWREIKADKDRMPALDERITVVLAAVQSCVDRVAEVEVAPKNFARRLDAYDAGAAAIEKSVEKLTGRIASVSAKQSVQSRWVKKQDNDNDDDGPETEPAVEAEMQEDLLIPFAPVSSAPPSSFGKSRRVG